MINGKHIVFGLGTIMIGADYRGLTFTWIQPPQEIGGNVNKENFEMLQTIKFKFGEDMFGLQNQLNNLTEGEQTIEFREYILDFTNYNEKSASVVKEQLKEVVAHYMMNLAC